MNADTFSTLVFRDLQSLVKNQIVDAKRPPRIVQLSVEATGRFARRVWEDEISKRPADADVTDELICCLTYFVAYCDASMDMIKRFGAIGQVDELLVRVGGVQ